MALLHIPMLPEEAFQGQEYGFKPSPGTMTMLIHTLSCLTLLLFIIAQPWLVLHWKRHFGL